MPCDTQSITSVNPIYAETISDIELIISEHVGDVCLGGDWNTDPRRNTAQTKCFNSFIERCGLKLGWDHSSARRQDTYFSESNDASSCIDHFLLNDNLFESISCCFVNTDPLNPSDHRDITLQVNYVPIACNTNSYSQKKQGISWNKVRPDSDYIDDYKSTIDAAIDALDIDFVSFACNDPLCSDISHREAINNLCTRLIDICLEAGNTCFPKVSPPRRHIPRWNADVKPLRDDALFWHQVWKDAGSPATGALAGIMRNTRAQYHRSVKEHKRNAEYYRNSMIANAIEKGEQRDIWSELKKLNNHKKVSPCSINGCSDNAGIANIFAHKYNELYSSVPTCQDEIDEINNEMFNELKGSHTEDVCINVSDVCKAIAKLNSNKRDGTKGTDSNHFINCSHKMKVLFTLMINSMLRHGFTPNDLLESVIISIPKDVRGNLCVDDNYRGIALCSALCKVIDLIIIDKYSDKLITSE